jgi:hypothetical protein
VPPGCAAKLAVAAAPAALVTETSLPTQLGATVTGAEPAQLNVPTDEVTVAMPSTAMFAVRAGVSLRAPEA